MPLGVEGCPCDNVLHQMICHRRVLIIHFVKKEKIQISERALAHRLRYVSLVYCGT